MISGKIVYNRHHFPIPDARGSVVELSQVQPEPSRGPGLHEGGETGQQGTSMLARDIYLPRRGGPQAVVREAQTGRATNRLGVQQTLTLSTSIPSGFIEWPLLQPVLLHQRQSESCSRGKSPRQGEPLDHRNCRCLRLSSLAQPRGPHAWMAAKS